MSNQFDAYLITNKVNGKVYVGITVSGVLTRWAEHLSRAKAGSKLTVHCAIRKYGEGAFSVNHVACSPTWVDLLKIEQQLIRQYASMGRSGYNSTLGGKGCLGYRFTPKQLAKLSVAHIGQERTAETRSKIAVASRGRKHTQLARDKIKRATLERFANEEYREANAARLRALPSDAMWRERQLEAFKKQMSDPLMLAKWKGAHQGHKHTEEAKAKMRAKALGRKMSPETREKLSASRRGIKSSPETCARRSAAKFAWWAAKKAQTTPLATPGG
jgi:group I intron endonuclease